MLIAVDPLLQRIEALPEHGCYSVTFVLSGNQERSVVMKVAAEQGDGGDGAPNVLVPEANLLPGWSPSSSSFEAVLAEVHAVDQARSRVDAEAAVLRDVDGGWDVGVGNIVLDDRGLPVCVAHGELEQAPTAIYTCPTCGAQARFGDTGR